MTEITLDVAVVLAAVTMVAIAARLCFRQIMDGESLWKNLMGWFKNTFEAVMGL